MSERETVPAGRRDLHAYHDGELGGLARWRFERRLQRDPALRRELAGLSRLGSLLRADLEPSPVPDLWDRIALRLPAVDARREAAATTISHGVPGFRAAGAVVAAAGLLLALWFGVLDSAAPAGGAVRWVDTGGRPVMVLDAPEESNVTIIWVLDDAVEGAATEVRSGVA